MLEEIKTFFESNGFEISIPKSKYLSPYFYYHSSDDLYFFQIRESNSTIRAFKYIYNEVNIKTAAERLNCKYTFDNYTEISKNRTFAYYFRKNKIADFYEN